MPKKRKSKSKPRRKRRSKASSNLLPNFFKGIMRLFAFVGILLFRLAPFFLFVAFVGAIYYGLQTHLYADPHFQLNVIRVKTDLTFTAKEIEKMSGLKLGDNILTADIQKAARKIEKNPQIKTVQVRRILPSTIEIIALRRFEAFQIYSIKQDRFYAIDENGMILPKTSLSSLPELVLIEEENLRPVDLKVGDNYSSSSLLSFRKLYEFLRTQSVLATESVEKLSLDRLGNFSVFLGDGLKIYLGENYIRNLKKINSMKHILNSNDRENIEYLDLQYKDVVVKMKK